MGDEGSIFCESLKVHLYLGPVKSEGLVFGPLIVYIGPLFVFEAGSIGPFFYFGMVPHYKQDVNLFDCFLGGRAPRESARICRR